MSQFLNECQTTQVQLAEVSQQLQGWLQLLFKPFAELQEKWHAVETAAQSMNQSMGQMSVFFAQDSIGAGTQRRKAGAKKWMMSENIRFIQQHLEQLHHLLMDEPQMKEMLMSMSSIDSSDDGLEASINRIAETKRIIIDVNHISLNSILFAIHLGETGASYERVSDHLHETSMSIDRIFGEIIEVLNTVITWNDNFKAHLRGILETQDALKQSIVPKVDEQVVLVEQSVGTYTMQYTSLIDLVNVLNKEYNLLVEQIAQKPYYAQLMDKWVESFATICEQQDRMTELSASDVEVEQLLDYITFVQKGVDAMMFIAPFAVTAIERFSDSILSITGEGRERMVELLPSMEELSLRFKGQSDQSAMSLEAFLEFLRIHLMQVGIVQHSLDDSAPFNSEIGEYFHKLENLINGVAEEVSMLDIIRFLSHVELAKVDQVTLKAFGVEIDQVVLEVTQAIQSNAHEINEVKISMQKILEAFKELRLRNQRHYQDEIYHIDRAQERLKHIHQTLSESFSGLSELNKDIVKAYDGVMESLAPMNEALNTREDLMKSMRDVNEQIQQFRQRLLNHQQLLKWDIKNPELSELASRFQDLIMEFQMHDQTVTRQMLSA